jgi:tRNA1Val (adenine37-N6)-methyltransferase
MKVGTDSMILGSFLDKNYTGNALDIGAGTGVLSLMLAQNSPDLQIDAIEIDKEAFSELEENFSKSPFDNDILAIYGDFLSFDFQQKYDVIISNPPFFHNSLKSEIGKKNLARHSDSLSIIDLFSKVESLLYENGVFCIILPHSNLIPENKLQCERKIQIFGKENHLTRTIYFFRKMSQLETSNLSFVIRDEFGNYTEEYKLLTKDFHNKEL